MQLPGRSDNEIKNFWHKRAKKCQKRHIPIYSTTTIATTTWKEGNQSHTNDKTNILFSSPSMIPSTQTLVSTSQPTESTYMIPSPQTIVSTTQPSESTYHTTAPSPDTPSCQNMYISPSQRSQSSSYAFFTPIIDPPILSSPPGRFKRFSTPQNTLTTPPFPPQNSSLQNMESPTSSLKLNLSVPQQTTTCLGAPPLSPLSPLKLCLSSNFPNSSNVRSNSSTTPMTDHTDNVIPQYFSLKSEPRTIQIGQPETGQVSESNLKIMDELREAEAKVKYLKKMLKQKRIPQKTNLQKPSTRKLDFLDENLEAIRVPSPSEMTQNYIDSEKVTKQDEANMDNQHSLQRAYGILEVKNLEEQRHSISNIDAANSNSWDNKLCAYQVPAAGKCFNGWSSTSDGLFIETLQDSFLKGYGFDQRSGSGIKQPVSDGFGIVYSQSTATTVNIRPGDESGCFDDNFGQKDTHFMDSNIVTMTSCEANLLWIPYPGIDLQESSYLVDQTMMERESEINLIESSLLRHQSPTTKLLDSSYLESKQTMEQETSNLRQSTLLRHHNPSDAHALDPMLSPRGFNNHCPRDEQHQAYAGGYFHPCRSTKLGGGSGAQPRPCEHHA